MGNAAASPIPNQSASGAELIERDRRFCLHGWGYTPRVIAGARGTRFWDAEGNTWLDMMSGTAGPATVGWQHPKVVAAVQEQAGRIMHVFSGYVNEPRARLSERLAAIAPGRMKDNCLMYISGGGSEAVETALKLAMLATGKSGIISTYHAYHGSTLALMSLAGQPGVGEGPWPRFPGFQQIPNAYCYRCYFGQKPDSCDLECANLLESTIRYAARNDVAAFVQEPVPGMGGHMVPPRRYFARIREICDRYSVLHIVDEVQTGVGRSGEWWACDAFGIDPDILVTSKAIGGGMGVAATIARRDVVPESLLEGQWHIYSTSGNPVVCAAGVAVLDVIEEEHLIANARVRGARIAERLLQLREESPIVGDVRAIGLYIGVEIVADKATREPWIKGALSIGARAFERGVVFGVSGRTGHGNVIKMKPPLCIDGEDVELAMDTLAEAVRLTARERQAE